MFLEFHIINTPFGWIMDLLYRLTTDYGLTLILFAIFVKPVMLPISAKSKRSMMKMSRITPLVQKLQDKYNLVITSIARFTVDYCTFFRHNRLLR